jgi:ABC-type sugar transport system substrate-binding protein
MKEFPELTVMPPFYEEIESRDFIEFVDEQLQDPDLAGIFDISYKLDFISDRVRAHGNNVKVVGFDLSKSIRQNMLEHLLDAIVFQDMFAQGNQAVKSLFGVLSGNDYPRGNIITKLEVVFEENLGYYM